MTTRMPIRRLITAGTATALLAAACSAPDLPTFDRTDVTRIEITNSGGTKAVAAKDRDNLYDLLNRLHLGKIKASARRPATPPSRPAYTAVPYHDENPTLTVDTPDKPTSDTFFIHDPAHPDRDGTYPVTDPIKAADLDIFIRENPR